MRRLISIFSSKNWPISTTRARASDRKLAPDTIAILKSNLVPDHYRMRELTGIDVPREISRRKKDSAVIVFNADGAVDGADNIGLASARPIF